ncbi:MAG: DUF853 domain-containing protein [Planctomycetaceae bacterium]|nr:DUF853 domain-containing protein [Planctomycetaceae bacterium]
MFGRKKKKETDKPVLSPVELAEKIGQQAGLLPDEMLKLLHSLEQVEKHRRIIRRKAVQEKIVNQKPIDLPEAVEFAKERVEEHNKREEEQKRIHRKKHLKYFETESRGVIEESEYPKELSPLDIGKSIEIAYKRLLEEEERKKEADNPVQRRAELILKALDRTKITEVGRIAKKIAARQKRIGLLSLEEAEWLAKLTPEEREALDPEVEEQLEIAKSLQGFKKHINTVVDDAAEVVKEDVDAAAAVVRQWVGTIHEEK